MGIFRFRINGKLIFLSAVIFFCFFSIIDGQTIIKEKVKIQPSLILQYSTNNSNSYEPIMFYFGGPRPFNYSITGPDGTVNGSNAGFGAPISEVPIQAVYGNYHVTVTSTCECNSNVGYWVTWQDTVGNVQWISGYEMWFSYDGGSMVREDSFIFDKVPYTPPEDIKIKITLTGEKSIWPELPAGQRSSDYQPTTNAMVKVTKGTHVLPNQEVNLKLIMVTGTGGHDHIPPAYTQLPAPQSGKIKYNGIQSNPNTLTTNQFGETTTEEILASPFGGEFILEASLKLNPTIKDTVHIIVKVPGLVKLPLSENYIKIGGTDKHLGPPFTLDDSKDHNHWGTNDLFDAIQNLSIDCIGIFKNVPKLQINDMSLFWGGVFDIAGTWKRSHYFHRVGTNVDIQSKFMVGERFYDTNKNGEYDVGEPITAYSNGDNTWDSKELKKFIVRAKEYFKIVNFEVEPVTIYEHWHLNLRGGSEK
jgi:hypothetical protein